MKLSHNDVIGLAILKKLEEYRIKLDTGELQPGCPDHAIRMCEAIVTYFTQFKTRCEWGEEIKSC
jgi:hypothetical protein